MGFKRVFRGYDPAQVNQHIQNLTQKHEQIRLTQKQYLEELTEENFQLRQQVKQYKLDEQAIAKSLVDSQKLANELKNDAQKYSDLVLTRAKVFYAAWQTYSQTLIATLEESEIIAFNKIMAKVETIINAYEGKDVLTYSQNIASQAKDIPDQGVTDVSQTVAPTIVTDTPADSPNVAPTDKTMGVYANPITKVEQAAHVIDLNELVTVDATLEELCKELGLIPSDDQTNDQTNND